MIWRHGLLQHSVRSKRSRTRRPWGGHPRKEVEISGSGNGPVAAYANALEKLGIDAEVQSYSQQSRSAGDDAEAACYIYATVNGSAAWGVGIAGSITRASIKALTSAVNRSLASKASVLAGGV